MGKDLTLIVDKNKVKGLSVFGYNRLILDRDESLFDKIIDIPSERSEGVMVYHEDGMSEEYTCSFGGHEHRLRSVLAARLAKTINRNSRSKWNLAVADFLASLGSDYKVILYWDD